MAAKKFLTYGEFVDTISHPETVTETWEVRKVLSTATLPVIQGAVWKAEDGSLGVFLVNYLDEEKSIDLNIDPARYGLNSTSGKYVIRTINPEGDAGKAAQVSGPVKRVEKLGPFGIRVFTISAK